MLSDFNFWNYLSKDASKYKKENSDVQKIIDKDEMTYVSNDKFLKTDVAKDWGKYILEVGKKATSKAVKQVSYAADQIRQNVAEIGIIEESNIISKFSDEQARFVEQKRSLERKTNEKTLPWIDLLNRSDDEQQIIKSKILSISTDERNFMRNPPPGGDFDFNYELHAPVAKILLSEDISLAKMRFKLVPKKISEEIFWRNYFYRVFLIKQSLQCDKDSLDGGIVKIKPEFVCQSSVKSEPSVGDSCDNIVSAMCVNIPTEEKATVPDTLSIRSGIDNDEWEVELQKELSEFELINEDKNQEGIYGDESCDYDDLEREIESELEK